MDLNDPGFKLLFVIVIPTALLTMALGKFYMALLLLIAVYVYFKHKDSTDTTPKI